METRDLAALAAEQYCYLTTTGRVTGNPHMIEIWFALEERTVYMLAGSREQADWVRNLLKNPAASVRIAQHVFQASGRIVEQAEEDARARELVVAKYQPGYGEDLSGWGRTALPVALDLV